MLSLNNAYTEPKKKEQGDILHAVLSPSRKTCFSLKFPLEITQLRTVDKILGKDF